MATVLGEHNHGRADASAHQSGLLGSFKRRGRSGLRNDRLLVGSGEPELFGFIRESSRLTLDVEADKALAVRLTGEWQPSLDAWR